MSGSSRCHQRAQTEANEASSRFRPCRHCGQHFSIYHNAWKIHEPTCPLWDRQENPPGSPQAVVHDDLNSAKNPDSESNSDTSIEMFADTWDDWATPKASLGHQHEADHPGHVEDTLSEHSMAQDQYSREPTADPESIPPLGETDVWVKRHPASGQPSGLLAPKPQGDKPQAPPPHSNSQLPPFFPFRTMDDFIQAEIFSDYGATDDHINRQLHHDSKSTLRDAKDYHNTLKIASQLHGEFITKPVVTTFEGREFVNQALFQPPLAALAELVGDPEFASDMVYYPEELHIRRPGTDGEPMQVWEELWHAKLWWNLQASLMIYIDETNVSKIGGVKVWPIYMWVGNLPASIRKRRGEKGGGTLIGYLPKAPKDLGVSDLAGLRCQVYHDTLRSIFEELKIPARHGIPMRCGDGIVRNFVPVIAATAADYMEFIRMVCILGHNSGFPCPICLVPRLEQSKLMEVWPTRTVSGSEDVLDRANQAPTISKRNEILHEQSLRNIRSAFLDLIPPIHSIYDAIIADPLHQIEQGVWGKHLWPWIKNQLPDSSKQILDDRMKAIPRYPDLKHFPNGITDLEYITGKEHGVILRVIVPLISDLIVDEYRKIVLGTFRSLAKIYLMAKFTTHNDLTLEALDKEIARFDRLHRKLAKTFDGISANYPKFHSLSHLTDIIRRLSTTDNYHTGLGEAMHPQSKRDYRRTNRQMNFEIQMLRMYQEREAIMRIRARIDAAAKSNDEPEDNVATAWNGPRVYFGSSDRNGRQLAAEFVQRQMDRNASARNMARYLRIFLYQRIGGYGTRVNFRESDLPHLDGMLVSTFNLTTIGYISMVDSRDGLDVARATESWRNQGPRNDYVIASDKGEFFVAQILKLFHLRIRRDAMHPLVYARLFRVDRRSKTMGFIELTDTGTQTFIFPDAIIRSCVVLSPGIKESKHVLWDLEGADMYLRLKDL
ncbi:hypothetical protein FS749_012061 [Ceratobasidium sp. UAMH 11750]|nr:hypothetical protein FS749_012061 [Ceratobasidium sp. UAMH 11750]